MPSRPAVRHEVIATGLNVPESAELAVPVMRHLKKGGRLSYVERTGHTGADSAWARSWLTWGNATTSPSLGGILVRQRDANRGHAGFFVSRTPTRVRPFAYRAPT